MSKDPSRRSFHLATDAEIKAGEVHDVYFSRTVQILRQRGDDKRAKAEVRLKSFPLEGTIFGPYEPVLAIEGTYVEWASSGSWITGGSST